MYRRQLLPDLVGVMEYQPIQAKAPITCLAILNSHPHPVRPVACVRQESLVSPRRVARHFFITHKAILTRPHHHLVQSPNGHLIVMLADLDAGEVFALAQGGHSGGGGIGLG